MKKFKNNNFVVHSDSVPLLNAFYELALKIGRKDDTVWNKKRLTTYTYLWFSDVFGMQFHNHNCNTATTELYYLPQDWDKALALASEVVEPKVVKAVIPKSEFNVGNWVINKTTSAVYKIKEIDRDGWCNGETDGGGWNPSQLRLATEDEIKQQLIKQARDKGFVDGVTFLGCEGVDKNRLIKIGVDYQINAMIGTVNEGVHCGDSWILHKGKWGTIVEDKPITYKRGDRVSNDYDKYIIARESANPRSLILVNLTDGNIWNNAVEVNNPSIITEKEFQLLSSGGTFKLIK